MDMDKGLVTNNEQNNLILEAYGQSYLNACNIPKKGFIYFHRCKKTIKNTDFVIFNQSYFNKTFD